MPEDRMKKNSPENMETAKSLRASVMKSQHDENNAKKAASNAAKSRKSGVGLGSSELDSLRGSEERGSSVQAPTRGTKRARDHDFLEKVGSNVSSLPW